MNCISSIITATQLIACIIRSNIISIAVNTILHISVWVTISHQFASYHIRAITSNCDSVLSRSVSPMPPLPKGNVRLMRLCVLWATDSIEGNEYRDRRKQEYQRPLKTSWSLRLRALVAFSLSLSETRWLRWKWPGAVKCRRSIRKRHLKWFTFAILNREMHYRLHYTPLLFFSMVCE